MTQREDIFRLPPLTMAEAKVVNTILQLRMLPDHETTPELMRKVKILGSQIATVMDLQGKTVVYSKRDENGPVRGTVREVVTHEEYKEHDWEDVDRFDQYDEERRGTMLITVVWHYPDGDEVEKGFLPEDLKVVE